MSEKKIEKYLKEQVKAQGGFTRKWVSPGHVGVEDQICFFPNGELWFIEVKDNDEKPTGSQWREIFEQLMLGHNAGYLAGKDEVDAFLKFNRSKYWMTSHIKYNVNVSQLRDVHVEFLKQMG